jgi:multidrug resistance efflux pump
VKSDELTVRSDEEAVADTKLYAPQDGTIVTLSGQVGEPLAAVRPPARLDQGRPL